MYREELTIVLVAITVVLFIVIVGLSIAKIADRDARTACQALGYDDGEYTIATNDESKYGSSYGDYCYNYVHIDDARKERLKGGD